MNISELPGISAVGGNVSDAAIQSVESTLGMLPLSYRELLKAADGFSMNNGLTIYSSSDVIERNRTFEVDIYAPGFIAIGDDGGGRCVLISVHGGEVYLVDQGSMDADEMKKIGASIPDWVSNGARLP